MTEAASGHTSAVHLPDQWFPVCTARELRGRPIARVLQGVPLALFRDASGAPAALVDRCPHRNVPLSLGRRAGDHLQCAYHGWRFGRSGACVAVPGLADAGGGPGGGSGGAGGPWRAAVAHAAAEQDGLVWVFSTPGSGPGEPPPFRFPHLADARYTTVRHAQRLRGTVLAAVENALDVPHTAFLHGGLFRTPRRRSVVEVTVRRGPDRVEAEYVGEPRPAGLLGRLLAPGGGTVEHFDRFLLPCLAQVEYRLGPGSHLVVTTAFTPVTDDEVHLFTAVSFRVPIPGVLVRPFVAPLALRVLAQDARMLAAQADNVTRFGGEQFANTELDVLGPHVGHLLRRAARGEPGEPFEPRSRRMEV
jgi:phenylpropionate dioxygenase-like ring-hydroxylating dioxygenase large terminal subunit